MKGFSKLSAVLLAMSLLLCGCSGDGEEAPEAKTLTLGQVADGVYTNEYLDAAFAPEGWQITGAEDLQDALAGTSEMLEGTELEEKIKDLQQVMDMQAVAPDGMTNVNVVYTRMKSAERLANLAISEEDAMDAVLAQSDTITEAYANAGLEVQSMEKVSLTYRGEDRIGIRTLCTAQGMDMCIIQVYERTLGSYSVVVTATALAEEDAVAVLSMFDKLNP